MLKTPSEQLFLNHPISFVCTDLPPSSKSKKGICDIKLEEALKRNDTFTPACNKDGSFQDLQCFKEHCWCVLPSGQYLPDTFHPRVMDAKGKPNCAVVKGKMAEWGKNFHCNKLHMYS